MKKILLLVLISSASLISCTHSTKPSGINDLTICEQGKCSSQPSTNAIDKLQHLFQTHSDKDKATLCSADADQHKCHKPKVCHFVLGGILPGSGCASSLSFADVKRVDQQLITMKADMPLKFWGTPVVCKTAEALLTNNANQLSLTLKPHICNWMVMGFMTAKLDFHINWINLDTNEIGGYWHHSVSGTGNGRGSGYMIMQFSNR
jgi:hypothetical protein